MMSPKGKITVMLADDQLIAREGWKRILETSEEIKVIGEAATSHEAARKATELQPQILLMDLKWFGDESAGWTAIREIKKTSPDVRVIAVTAYENLIRDARLAGADAALLKTFSRNELIELIEAVSKTDINMTVTPISSMKSNLTSREIDILHLIAKGMRDKEISISLGISLATVKNHIRNILSKFDVTNRTNAVSRARELKLLD
jgi:DNA-binding NarL/FixJ family response regulator